MFRQSGTQALPILNIASANASARTTATGARALDSSDSGSKPMTEKERIEDLPSRLSPISPNAGTFTPQPDNIAMAEKGRIKPIPSRLSPLSSQFSTLSPHLQHRDVELQSPSPSRQDFQLHQQQVSRQQGNNRLNGQIHRSANSSAIHLDLGIPRLIEKLHWRDRVRHFTWSFFTLTMATGGIANVLHEVPFRFTGLYEIGLVFYLGNIAIFVFFVFLMILRFSNHPEMFWASVLHPTERLFVPAAVVSFGTVLLNTSQYGPVREQGHWLNDAISVLFWIDSGLAFLASFGVYLTMWSTASFTISQMTPIWIFPAYPLLILGPHAAVLSQTIAPDRAKIIIIGGVTLQGIGFLVSFMIYSAFIYRLMVHKLPQEGARPGMFVAVGPSAFTAAGLVGMSEGAQRALPSDFMGDGAAAKMILKVLASFSSLWLWGLAFWFFFVAVGAHWSCIKQGHHLAFSMTFFSYIFPQTALITATFAIGEAFDSKAIKIIGCVMTPLLILVWFGVCFMMVRSIFKKEILWPQKGEDKDEGGFREPPRRRARTLST